VKIARTAAGPPSLTISYLSRFLQQHDEPSGSSAQLGSRKGYPSIMVDVLRGDLLPTTANIELPKSQPQCIKDRH
jgi:hypothetical protein